VAHYYKNNIRQEFGDYYRIIYIIDYYQTQIQTQPYSRGYETKTLEIWKITE